MRTDLIHSYICFLVLFVGMTPVLKAQEKHDDSRVEQVIAANNKLFQQLTHADNTTQLELADSVLQTSEQFIPPILFATANVLYKNGQKQEALYWYYIAKLNALCDAQLSETVMQPYAQKTVQLYTQQFGEAIERYAVSHLATVMPIIDSVKTKVAQMKPRYFKGWIFIDGNADNYNKQNLLNLYKPVKQWPAIRQKTIMEFGF